ncbi:unnamed protein product [Pocillopora meandrina]|uniref:EGF-like domain-containing protein n=1 Tax=Pocillopora meandrina TaxID=46732 RepID=A0AAU9XKV0_9CNID|nr:unnamed protein product [Pocillopora meandrina]
MPPDFGCRSLRFKRSEGECAPQRYVFKETYLPMGEELMTHDCRYECLIESNCLSVNIGPPNETGFRLCQLSTFDHTQHREDKEIRKGFILWASENSCTSNPCLHDSTCLNGYTDKRYICLCPDNYTGENCEKDRNECIDNSHDCHAKAVCNNTEGSFTCSCTEGYQGNGRNCTEFRLSRTQCSGHGVLCTGVRGVSQCRNRQHKLIQRLRDLHLTGVVKVKTIIDQKPTNSKYEEKPANIERTMILPLFDYCSVVWNSCGAISKGYLDKLNGRAASIILNRAVSETDIVCILGWPSLQFRRDYLKCMLVFKSMNGSAPSYLLSDFTQAKKYHTYNTRHRDLIRGGGGGFYSSGRSSKQFGGTMGTGGEGGKGFLQGGVGGKAMMKSADGGFGGGAGGYGWSGGAGGGGGYSGGSSGSHSWNSCGGGGGSYNVGKYQQNDCCYRSNGHGQVIITLL